MKRLDPVVPISEQYPTEGPFSLLIYKLTDHLVKLDSGDPVHQQIISNFQVRCGWRRQSLGGLAPIASKSADELMDVQRYEQEHPECVFIDVARAQERVIDRLKVYELLDGCMDGKSLAILVLRLLPSLGGCVTHPCTTGEEVADVVCPRFYTVQEGDSETERVLQGFTYPVSMSAF